MKRCSRLKSNLSARDLCGLHDGIEITPPEIGETGEQFHIGRVTITQQALAFCETHNIQYLNLIIQHTSGNFGMVGHLDNAQLTRAERNHGEYATDDGLKLNAVAIQSRQGMVLSIYPHPSNSESKIWIQTFLTDDATTTIILLPHDYGT